MTSFRKILVPLDGSPQSEAVLPLVRRLAESEGAQVVLLRVADTQDAVYSATSVVFGAVSPEMEREVLRDAQSLRERAFDEARLRAEGYLQRIATQHFAPGSNVQLEVSGGRTADAILGFAAGIHADLIALSLVGWDEEHARPSTRVADQVIHRAAIPVLSVRGE
jgi:nucleotide-binding universal stress UspA family protein